MLKDFLKKIIINLIELIEKFEYRNRDISSKIIESINVSDEELYVETDTGYSKLISLHKTKPYRVYELVLSDDIDELNISCADEHILFDENMNEIFVKDLSIGDLVQTKNGLYHVKTINILNEKVSMYDCTLDDNNHRFYTNNILSHNTIMTAIFLAHYSVFNTDRTMMVISNKGQTTKEILDKYKVIIENLPFFMKPGIIKNDVMEIKFDNGCRIVGQNTTKRSGISYTIHGLYIDEMAHIPDNIIRELYENAYPTLASSKISKIILTSTQNGYNLFQEIFDAAETGLTPFKAHKINWWDIPGRDETWMHNQIAALGSEESFLRQYGTNWMTNESRLLTADQIKRLESDKKRYVFREFEELSELDLDYEKYLKFDEDFDIEKIKDKNSYFIFSIDIAEGGGGDNDYSIINIFEVDIVDAKYFNVLNANSFYDFFKLKQVGFFKSNETSIEDLAKILYTLTMNVFNIDKIKLLIEINTYGNELILQLSTVFPSTNNFDEEVILRFLHRADATVRKYGLKVRLDNKPILAQNFKNLYGKYRIDINEQTCVSECIMYGKTKNGTYEGLGKHDDAAATCINISSAFQTIEFFDFCEYKYDLLDMDTKREIETVVGGNGDVSQFNIYDIL